MSKVVVGELAGACNNKTLTVVLKIKGDSTPAAGTGYAAGDSYKYTKVLALDANSEANANSVELTSAN